VVARGTEGASARRADARCRRRREGGDLRDHPRPRRRGCGDRDGLQRHGRGPRRERPRRRPLRGAVDGTSGTIGGNGRERDETGGTRRIEDDRVRTGGLRALLARKETAIFILLLVVCIGTAIKEPLFLSRANLQNNATQIGLYGIFSLGMGFVIVTGGIDLSVGSVFALLGVIMAILLKDRGWNPWLTVVVVLGISSLMGWLNGLLIARVKLQPFIVTLSGLLIYRGLARLIANDETTGFGQEAYGGLRELATGNVLGIPKPFLLLIAISVVLWFVLHRSVYGRHLLAVGRNEDAARYAGINTRRVVTGTYVLMGLLAGIGAILFAFFTNSIGPSNFGQSYELYAIAAAVLGGCSLRGG
ncbi:ABC transporter permease, partial [bacterium]